MGYSTLVLGSSMRDVTRFSRNSFVLDLDRPLKNVKQLRLTGAHFAGTAYNVPLSYLYISEKNSAGVYVPFKVTVPEGIFDVNNLPTQLTASMLSAQPLFTPDMVLENVYTWSFDTQLNRFQLSATRDLDGRNFHIHTRTSPVRISSASVSSNVVTILIFDIIGTPFQPGCPCTLFTTSNRADVIIQTVVGKTITASLANVSLSDGVLDCNSLSRLEPFATPGLQRVIGFMEEMDVAEYASDIISASSPINSTKYAAGTSTLAFTCASPIYNVQVSDAILVRGASWLGGVWTGSDYDSTNGLRYTISNIPSPYTVELEVNWTDSFMRFGAATTDTVTFIIGSLEPVLSVSTDSITSTTFTSSTAFQISLTVATPWTGNQPVLNDVITWSSSFPSHLKSLEWVFVSITDTSSLPYTVTLQASNYTHPASPGKLYTTFTLPAPVQDSAPRGGIPNTISAVLPCDFSAGTRIVYVHIRAQGTEVGNYIVPHCDKSFFSRLPLNAGRDAVSFVEFQDAFCMPRSVNFERVQVSIYSEDGVNLYNVQSDYSLFIEVIHV